ncbi:MAG: alpha/beta fold hydrolase [Lentisphaeria bacterium]|nr:alpha/beta fold hydrolase [Lentisphaeria bacterium]
MLSLNHRYKAADQLARKPLIILHGLFGSSANWMSFMPKFSQYRDVYAIDLRNHGRSPHDRIMTIYEMALDIEQFMESHKIDQAHILGHSLGGKVAMELALCWPEKVSSLIVGDIAPFAYTRHDREPMLRAIKDLDLDFFRNRDEVDEALKQAIPNNGIRLFMLTNLQRQKDGMKWRCNMEAIYNHQQEINSFPETDKQYSGKTTFIAGSNSDYLTPDLYPSCKNYFPNADIEVIQDAGHWLHAEKPDEFTATVLEHLKDSNV